MTIIYKLVHGNDNKVVQYEIFMPFFRGTVDCKIFHTCTLGTCETLCQGVFLSVVAGYTGSYRFREGSGVICPSWNPGCPATTETVYLKNAA